MTCITPKQINKVKGYEITFYTSENKATVLGFVKTLNEARSIIDMHKLEHAIKDHIYNSVLVRG